MHMKKNGEGASMIRKSIWRGVLVAILSTALATHGLAEKPRLAANGSLNIVPKGLVVAVVAGIAVAAVAVVVVTVVLVKHHKRQRITGCIYSGANGMSVTDEKDKLSYALSGSTADVKAGYRMTLEGKRKRAGHALAFETHKVGMDFGACQI
jgi:mannitol-specific phosphotransferase system IIBC component